MLQLIVKLAIGFAYLAAPAAATYRQLGGATLTLRERGGLSLALGPAIMSLCVMACRLAGASMETSAWVTFSLACAAVLVPSRRTIPLAWPPRRDVAAGAMALAISFAWVASFWLADQRMRIFNWHGLMQIDICNALERERLPPQEPELAGLRCSYAWVVHCFWAAQARIAGLAPTRLMAVNNAAWAVAQILLGCSYARRLGLSAVTSWAAAVLGVIGTNAVAITAAEYTAGLPIDWRLAPALAKFCNLDTMPLALPLFTGLLALAAWDPLDPKFPRGVFFLTAVALALVYPVMLPALAAVVAAFCSSGFLAAQRFSAGSATALLLRTPLPGVAAAGITAIAVALGFAAVLSVDRATPGLRLVSPLAINSAQAWKLARMVMAVAPLVPFALIAITSRDLRTRFAHSRSFARALGLLSAAGIGALAIMGASAALKWYAGLVVVTFGAIAATAALGGIATAGRRASWWAGVACLGAYAICDVEMLEYKYVLAATIALAPFTCEGLEMVFLFTGRREWLCFGTAAVLAGGTLYGSLCCGVLFPGNLTSAPRVTEEQAQLTLSPQDSRAGWVAAIKASTPPDAVVVSRHDEIHVAAFLDRALYAPSDIDGMSQAGYSIDSQQNMTDYRGHSLATYASRLATVQRLFNDESGRHAALDELMTAWPTIAVHVRAEETQLDQFFASTNRGVVVYRDDNHSVWVFRRPH